LRCGRWPARRARGHFSCLGLGSSRTTPGQATNQQGDSTARDPAHCRDQRTRVTVLKWRGSRAPGLPSCRTRSASCDRCWRTLGTGALTLRFFTGEVAIVSEADVASFVSLEPSDKGCLPPVQFHRPGLGVRVCSMLQTPSGSQNTHTPPLFARAPGGAANREWINRLV